MSNILETIIILTTKLPAVLPGSHATIYINYSLCLLLIFIGNCSIIKPSEVSQASAKCITSLISKYMDPVSGDIQYLLFSRKL